MILTTIIFLNLTRNFLTSDSAFILTQLQSTQGAAAARVVYSKGKYDHATALLNF